MKTNDLSIVCEGVELTPDSEEKVHNILKTMKSISVDTNLSVKLLQNGNSFEGLLWGNVSGNAIGAFSRGPSINQVLDSLLRRVRRDCLKVLMTKSLKNKGGKTNFGENQSAMAS